MSPTPIPIALLALSAAATAVPAPDPVPSGDPALIVFVRGGAGTTGHISGTGLDSLSSIDNRSTTPGNHGYSQLAERLRDDGHVLVEIAEGPLGAKGPADVLGWIDDADVFVFTSNNVVYPPETAGALAAWVCGGGGVYFASDGDWGLDWGEGPSSDQSLLGAYDLVMNQDKGTYAISRAAGDFVVGGVDTGDHPILAGPDGVVGTGDDVDVFDGEGVSPLTVTSTVFGVFPTILANAKVDKRLNDSPGLGSVAPVTPDDASLVVVEYGTGRVVGHYDRNTFHNTNGAGTDITKLDNEQYASNVFAWLVDAPGPAYGTGCATSGAAPALTLHGCPRAGESIVLDVDGGLPGGLAYVFAGFATSELALPNGCALLVHDDVLPTPPALALSATGDASLPAVVPAGAEGIDVFVQVWTTDGTDISATNGVRLGFF